MDGLSVSHLLKHQESLGLQLADPAKPSLDIAFGIDEKYARHMGVLMTSLIANNSDYYFVFHVFTDSILKEDRRRLAQLAEQNRLSIHIYYIAADILNKLPTTVQYPAAIYYRLLMPEILRECATRVLYLDSDIICIGHLPHPSELEMAGNPAAAIMDVEYIVKEKTAELALTHGSYFNSGVMLINIKEWNAANISSRVLNVLHERGSTFSLMDQDALNIVLDGKVTFLPPIWNQVYNLGQMTHDPAPGSQLLHYAGAIKPWRLSGRHRLSEHYRQFENQSLWAGIPLSPPAGYKEMETYARLSLKAGDIRTGLYWYWRYLQTKFL